MKKLGFVLQVIVLALLCGCNTLTETAKSRLSNGYYKCKNPDGILQNRYVLIKNDTIRAFPVNRSGATQVIDTTRATVVVFPKETDKPISGKYAFSKNAWDLNFQAILFKFRPARANIPNQLNTEFNLNLYLGRRSDIYRISYQANPLALSTRKVYHLGYSFGFFTGLGETPVGSSVTRKQLTYIYDGVVWLNGVSGIIGINSFTLGMGIGMDQLLDRNHDIWIYQRKPWIGLLLGIKLR